MIRGVVSILVARRPFMAMIFMRLRLISDPAALMLHRLLCLFGLALVVLVTHTFHITLRPTIRITNDPAGKAPKEMTK